MPKKENRKIDGTQKRGIETFNVHRMKKKIIRKMNTHTTRNSHGQTHTARKHSERMHATHFFALVARSLARCLTFHPISQIVLER